MSERVEPALTPEEWARFGCIRKPNVLHARDGAYVRNGHGYLDISEALEEPLGPEDIEFPITSDSAMVAPEARHALAALCLHGQPFGFTREDVERLRDTLDGLDISRGAHPHDFDLGMLEQPPQQFGSREARRSEQARFDHPLA